MTNAIEASQYVHIQHITGLPAGKCVNLSYTCIRCTTSPMRELNVKTRGKPAWDITTYSRM